MLLENDKINILKEIKSNGLPVGASYLKTKIGLSQATIGRILLDCEKEGLLEKVSNKGRVLTELGETFLRNSIQHAEKLKSAGKLIDFVADADQHTLKEVLEVRILLEAKTAAEACINATDEEIRNLENILFEYMYAINHGQLWYEQDLMFHLAIAKMSKNTTIYRILNLILTSNNEYQKFAIVSTQKEKMQIPWHMPIMDAIKQRNSDEAAKTMINHMEHIKQTINDVQSYTSVDYTR